MWGWGGEIDNACQFHDQHNSLVEAWNPKLGRGNIILQVFDQSLSALVAAILNSRYINSRLLN